MVKMSLTTGTFPGIFNSYNEDEDAAWLLYRVSYCAVFKMSGCRVIFQRVTTQRSFYSERYLFQRIIIPKKFYLEGSLFHFFFIYFILFIYFLNFFLSPKGRYSSSESITSRLKGKKDFGWITLRNETFRNKKQTNMRNYDIYLNS